MSVLVLCPMVYMGCNWKMRAETLQAATEAEKAHWLKFHEEVEDDDEADRETAAGAGG